MRINDIRRRPSGIPNSENAEVIEDLVNKEIEIKKSALEKDSEADYIDDDLLLIEQEIDNIVLSLYRILF